MASSVDVNLLHDLPPYDDAGRVRVVVEVPGGSSQKLKYDPELGVFAWSRQLSAGICFPYDYGFVPQTLADDNDAIDAIVFSDSQTFPGVVIPARVVGSLRIEQQRDDGPIKRNDRVVAVPANDHRHAHIQEIDDIAQRERDELAAFFTASLALTGKNITLRGWADRTETLSLISQAVTSYRKSGQTG